ncbi:MAG: hypothetical protein JXR49_20135 [Acidobacteria bacterium]|nr:hypothetical protein [Acidobacteriota bacterium]
MRNLSYAPGEADSQSDFVIVVDTGLDTHRLMIGIRGNGQPRYAREAVAGFLMQSGQSPKNAYPVFAAPFISKSAAEICREAGVGTIDLAGNCRLAFDGIYIERQGRPNRFVSKRSLRSLYEPRSSRVLRALLFDPNLTWKLTDLSEAAGVSIGQVFNVKKALADREWAVFDKEGLKLTEPERILRDWGKHYTCTKNTLFEFYSAETPAELESRLSGVSSETGSRYALTSFSASSRLATTGGHTHVYAYIDGDVDRVADLALLKHSDPESNVTLMLPHDEGVFFGMQEIAGLNVVSPIQAYLDLVGLEGKGTEEAAGTLFSRVIQKGWQPGTTPS